MLRLALKRLRVVKRAGRGTSRGGTGGSEARLWEVWALRLGLLQENHSLGRWTVRKPRSYIVAECLLALCVC